MRKKILFILAFTSITGTKIHAQIPTKGLVAWYPFTGNALDSSGNGNNGTVYGASLTTDRFENKNSAYSFDGKRNIIKLNDTLLNRPNLSISLWYYSAQIDSPLSKCLIGYKDSSIGAYTIPAWIELYSSSSFNVNSIVHMYLPSGFSNGEYLITYSPQSIQKDSNNWKHIVMLLNQNGNSVKIYKNGLLDTTLFGIVNEGELIRDNGITTVGGRYRNQLDTSLVDMFKGKIDDIRIYDRLLDSTDVQALYHEGGYNGSPLPIVIKTILANKKDKNIELLWQTYTELNISHFIIQHSTDGSSFTDMGTVKAIGGAANGYHFADNTPVNGINYYRLKSVDKDGAFSYSKVVLAQLTIDNLQLSISPNPSKDKITIKGSHIASVQVVDNLGRVIKTQSLKDSNNPTLSVGSLPVGVYHLLVKTTDGKVNGIGFVKE